ncbi:MAG: tetratricopeptide repeat protein [Anaerolineae bacterium]
MSSGRPPLADSYEGLHARARNLWMAGDLVGAASLYRRLVERLHKLSDRILERRPELRDLQKTARRELVGLLHGEGRYAEAMEIEQVLLETHPEDAQIWRRDLARLRIAKGEVEAGLAELRSLVTEDPADMNSWLALGIEARTEGRFVEGEEALGQALAVCPADEADTLAQIHYQRFLLYKDMGRVDDALEAWEAALDSEPEAEATINDVYEMLTEVGRYSEALEYVARDENDLQADFQRGLIASLTGKLYDAREAWRRVAEKDPDEYDYGHEAWVESVLRMGDEEKALEWLQGGLARHGSPRLFVLAGIAWAMHGDASLAARLFQQAINAVRHERPPRQKLESADWRLLETLVSDQETKKALKTYFAVVETLWV